MKVPAFRHRLPLTNRPSQVCGTKSCIAAAVVAVLAAGTGLAQGATYQWNQVTTGPFSWDNAGGIENNWDLAGFPDAPEDVANVTSDLVEPGMILLNTEITLGVLNIGDVDGSNAFSVEPGIGGSLLFDNGVAPAQVNQGALSAGDTIWAPVGITSALNITNASGNSLIFNGPVDSAAATGVQTLEVTEGNVRFAGDLGNGFAGGALSFVKSGFGTVSLLGNNTFTGGVTLNSGTMNVGSPTALGSAAGTLQINGGTLANSTGGTVVLANPYTQIWAGDFNYTGPNDLDLGTGIVAMTGSRQITVDAGALTVSGTIAESGGPAGITKFGAGTLALAGANQFSGPVTVNAGFLAIRHSQALGLGTDTVVVNPGGTLMLDGGVTVTGRTVSLSGEGAPSQNGALRGINGDNVWAGDIFANTTAIMRIVAGSGTLTIDGDIITSGTAANGLVFQGTGTVNGQITGDASMTRSNNDPGVWTLNNDNTYTGVTTISNGALRLGHEFAIRHSTVTLNSTFFNGLQFSPGIGTFRLVALNGASASNFTLNDTEGGIVTLSIGATGLSSAHPGAIHGTGNLEKVGAGTLTLTGASTFSGGLLINEGVVTANDPTVNGASQAQARTVMGSATVTLAGGTTLNLRGNGSDNSSQQQFDFGNAVVLTGPATINVNRSTGGGSSKILALGDLSAGSHKLTVVSGNNYMLRFDTATLTENATIESSTASGNVVLGDVVEIGGARSLEKLGDGRLTIAGDTSHTGGTNVNAGSLQVGLGGYSGTLSGAVNNAGSVTFSRADLSTFPGQITGAGSVTKAGSGTLVLTGANDFTGATVASNGTLMLDYASTASVLNAASPLTLGAGTLFVKGASTGTTAQTLGNLTTLASLTGIIAIDPNGGDGTTLTLGNSWTIGGSNGLHFDLTRGGTVLSSPAVSNGVIVGSGTVARVTVTGTDGRTYFATVSGGAIAPQTTLTPLPASGGSGNVNYSVSGEVTTTGNVSTGTLRIDTTAGPGFLDLGGNLTYARTAFLMDGDNDFEIKRTSSAGTVANVVIHQYGNGALTLSAPMASGGGFTKNGGGLLIGMMSSGAPAAVTLTDGVYRIGVETARPSGAVNITGGILELGSGDFVGTLGTGAGQVRITSNGGFSAHGATRIVNLGGAGNSITWDQGNFLPGNSMLLLSSKHSDATLDFQNPLLLGGIERTVQVNNGSADVDAILSGAVGGTAAFVKTGEGTLALNAANTFSGVTRVRGGGLQVNGTLSGAVEVDAGSLQGTGDGFFTGAIAGDLRIGDGIGTADAILSPGNGVGRLTTYSAINFAADGQFRFDLDSGLQTPDEMFANGVSIASGATFQAFELGTPTLLVQGTPFIALQNTSFLPIDGTFANLPEGGLVTIGLTTFEATYMGGDGNDLELTAVPEPGAITTLLLGSTLIALRRRRQRSQAF